MTRTTVLLAHSAIGVIIFITGLLQIFLKKGGKTHRITGRAYLHSWLFLLLSGAYLGGLLITVIGIFGYYFTLTGSRIGKLKLQQIQLLDKVIFITGALVSAMMLYYSLRLYTAGQTSFSLIFAVFGAIFLWTSIKDIRKYIFKKSETPLPYGKKDWYFEHFTRMFISFIAAVTAFVSIQNLFRNNTLNFLLPTLVGVILINMTQRHYRRKFKITVREEPAVTQVPLT